jgi:hypothetical protein
MRANVNASKVSPKSFGRNILAAPRMLPTLGVPSKPPAPREVVLNDFAAPAALYDLIQQLDLIAIIDRHAGKRAQGVSVGTYIALAAVNRCVAPTSKVGMADWYGSTVLRRLLPVPLNLLTSQRFWDHMSYLDANKIAAHRTGFDPPPHRSVPDRNGLSVLRHHEFLHLH